MASSDILLIGSSHVKRVDRFVQHNGINRAVGNGRVIFDGHPGATVDRLLNAFSKLQLSAYFKIIYDDHALLLIQTNDMVVSMSNCLNWLCILIAFSTKAKTSINQNRLHRYFYMASHS